MKLPEFIEYMARRFPPSCEIIDAQVSFVVERDSGIVETIELNGNDEEDDPDDGEQCVSVIQGPRPKLRQVI